MKIILYNIKEEILEIYSISIKEMKKKLVTQNKKECNSINL